MPANRSPCTNTCYQGFVQGFSLVLEKIPSHYPYIFMDPDDLSPLFHTSPDET